MKGYENLITIADFYDELAKVETHLARDDISKRQRGSYIRYSKKLLKDINFYNAQKNKGN